MQQHAKQQRFAILTLGSKVNQEEGNALANVFLEHGWQQGEAVRQAFILAGYHDVETCRDYGDNERVTLGRYYQ